MAKIVNQINWNTFSEKGEHDAQIREQFDLLISYYLEHILKKPFLENSNEFTEKFHGELQKKFKEIFAQFNSLPEREKIYWEKKVTDQLREHLDLLVNKKALCTIEFDSYAIYKFIESLASVMEEVHWDIKNDKISIVISDDSFITLAENSIKNDSYTFYREGSLALNLDDLKELLKANDKDNAHTTLIYGEDELFITILSQKFKVSIQRTLKQLDLDRKDFSVLNLHKIDYTCKFEITKEQLEYVITNSGKYSDVLCIECLAEELSFKESGQIGEGSMKFEKKDIGTIEFTESREKSKEQLREQESFTLIYFETIKKLASLLAHDDPIQFSLREDYPLKCIIKVRRLQDTKIISYHAPRADRDLYDEEHNEIDDF